MLLSKCCLFNLVFSMVIFSLRGQFTRNELQNCTCFGTNWLTLQGDIITSPLRPRHLNQFFFFFFSQMLKVPLTTPCLLDMTFSIIESSFDEQLLPYLTENIKCLVNSSLNVSLNIVAKQACHREISYSKLTYYYDYPRTDGFIMN